ncbi:MAG: amino acid adenylation domain-containing protein, partial [Bacteroidales bacterium]|nr:amino acid adenylation domain-containing protein [Bacteroidales bacterium]
ISERIAQLIPYSLPFDISYSCGRTANVITDGGRQWFTISNEVYDRLGALAQSNNATLYQLMYMLFGMLLSFYSGKSRFLISTPFANRYTPLADQVTGYGITILPLGYEIHGDLSFSDHLRRIIPVIREGFNQTYFSPGQIIKPLNERYPDLQTTLMQAMFILQNWEHHEDPDDPVQIIQTDIGNATAKMLVTLNGERVKEGLECWMEYPTRFMDDDLMVQMVADYQKLIDLVLEEPDMQIRSLRNRWVPDHPVWAVHPSAAFIGETSLVLACMKYWVESGGLVSAVMTKDRETQKWAESQGIYIIPFGKKHLPEFHSLVIDYLFSVVNSYILDEEILAVPRVGAINYHDAPLPAYAGVHATSWAIMEGQSTHGITWHYMVPETDEGPVIIQKPVKIEPQMKVSDLDAKCYELAIEAFKELTQSALHGKLKPIRVPGQKSYYGLHKKPEQGGIIDFSRPGSEIVNLYRALSFSKYYPNYFCSLKLAFPDQVLYPQQVEWLQRKSGEEPGTLLSVTDSAIQVACSDGIIYLSQFEDRFRNPVPLANLLPYLSSMTGKKVFSAPGNETVQWLESLSKKERKWVRYWSGKEELPAAPVPGVAGEQLIDEVKIPDMNDTEVAISLLVFMKLVDPDWTFGIEVVTGKAPEWIRWFTEPVLPVDIGKFDPEDFVALYESLKQQIEDATPENAFVSDLWYRHPELIRPGWNGPVYHWTVRFVPPDTPLREGDLAIHHGVIRLARGEDRERQMKITNWSERFIRLANYFHPRKFGDEIPKNILLLDGEKAIIPPEITWSYKAIGEWFLETARTYPEKTALKFQERALTFQEVYQTVRRVANFIYRPAVREARIAVCLERSPESVMAQLAIYLLGYTYIPIDPNNPETRIRYILQKSKPAVLLTDAALYREIQPYADIPVKLWDEMLTGKELHDFPEVSEKQIAYMLFTSGSTGEPKGVPIPYAALSRFIQDSIYRYNLTHQDTGLQFASLAFDASMEEIFPILLSGGTLVIRTEAWLGSVSGFLEQVNKHGITFLDLPTAYWQVVIRDIYKKKTGLPEMVRQVIIGGDYAQPSVFAMWQELFPEHPRLVNTYGPTEATVVCVAWDKTLAPENKEALPIGLPVNSLQARVVMENGLDAPPGIAGELWMGGPTLSPGYFENPDLTQKKWVHYHDIRWYRTGDWVWRNPDGVMYFQGRVDDQIKVGGFLVDLNEVLRVFSQLEGVREAAVRAVTMHDNQKMIIGYVLFPSGAPDESFIKERMARSLPAYMIPHRILAVDEIPYNQNNKVDWRKLPVPDPSSDAAGSSEKVTLTDPLEQKIQILFQEHLGVSYMDPDADIFEMGMSSLTAVAVLSELESHWGQPIPLAILLQYPTVRSLAAGLKESNEKEFFRPLVKIKTGGSKRPLFIIHGAGLNVLLFNTLKDLLDPGQPIYGIQAKGMDGESPILSKLEDIIDSYMSEIKSVQSIGPYALAGFSIGGLIAFELARQMQDQGDDVDFIGVFDTYAESSIQRWPKLKRMMYKMRWNWNRFWYNLFLVLKEPGDVLPKKLKWLKFKIKSRLTGGEPVRGEELEDLPDKLFHIANITIRAVLSLELKPFDGPVHVFRAAHRNFYIPDRVYLGWKPYAKGGVIIHEIPGDHSHIFAAPNDKEFAKVLQQALDDSYEEFMRKMNSDVKE